MKFQFDSTEELVDFLSREIISTAEVVEILGVTKVRVGHMVRDGKLKPIKEKPYLFLKSMVLEKKEEMKELRKKYRPYEE